MKKIKFLLLSAAMMMIPAVAMAQNSLPAPGGVAGGRGNSLPAPGGVAGGAFGPAWGSPWNSGWGPEWGPAYASSWQNSGTAKVLACGYDAQGVWRIIPLKVAYYYNGLQYNVTVLNAWNPWSDMWSYGVDQQAFNTSYYLRGQTFNFYVPLSTGTYYFNL